MLDGLRLRKTGIKPNRDIKEDTGIQHTGIYEIIELYNAPQSQRKRVDRLAGKTAA